MSLPEQYLLTTKNVEAFFNALTNAQPPKKFTQKFLEQLEFKSTNDRLLIGILKALGFIDSEGIPQGLYFEFIDQTQSKAVLAKAIKEAYSDLFAVNLKAHELTDTEVKNKFKTLFQGSKSDNVLSLMAKTFRALCEYADFSNVSESYSSIAVKNEEPRYEEHNYSKHNYEDSNYSRPDYDAPVSRQDDERNKRMLELKEITTEMHYNIQIHLPETRDMAVYDAIFRSLKEHLL